MVTDQNGWWQRVNPVRLGLAMMLIGALSGGIGLVQTTSAAQGYDDSLCPPGTRQIAVFEWQGNKYKQITGQYPSVTITNGTRTSGNWTSTEQITAFVVYGRGGAVVSNPADHYAGTFTNAGLPKVGQGKSKKTADIEKIWFCGPKNKPTTTTEAPTTTTEETTSTTEATTSTTEATTSTTEATTSTTEATTSTTEATTSTTEATTSTTEATTSTTEATTSTTESPTTTEVEVTTTTEAEVTTTTEGGGESTTSTTQPAEVEGENVVATSVIPKDRIKVLSDGTVRPLARTGSSSTPLIVLGIVLLGGGGTLVLVDRLRSGRARA